MDKPTLTRAQVRPLHEPPDIYAALIGLKIGEPVPPHIYITDYKDDSIPPWTVAEIERHGSLLILTVIDPTARKQETLFEPEIFVACDVFTQATKTLAGPFYGYYPGCEHARNMLADIRQHARQLVDRARKTERQAVA